MIGLTRNFAIMLATAVAAAALFWLLREHWEHALGALPYLLFLACPLMHLFMHRGHGDHGHYQGSDAPPHARTP
jgi:hypothetical protein